MGSLPKRYLRETFRVRQQTILNALNWLKTNNPRYYGHINISLERINQLPDDDIPEEVIQIVKQSCDLGTILEETDGYVPNEDGQLPHIVGEQKSNQDIVLVLTYCM